jgi:hypothetical protein
MPPASPPGLVLCGSSSSKYCQYLAYIRRKLSYPDVTHHRIIYQCYAPCLATSTGSAGPPARIIADRSIVDILPTCEENELLLCHSPQKNLLAVCRLPHHQHWGSVGPPARSIVDILSTCEENELLICHPPQKNLLAVCRLLLHLGWGSAGPPARSIADILPISEGK